MFYDVIAPICVVIIVILVVYGLYCLLKRGRA